MSAVARYNHVGHHVRDLGRARRFYVEVFGFRSERALDLPDNPSAQLLGVAPPLGLKAEYLRLGDEFVLELIELSAQTPPDAPPRVMSDIGLTHLSFSVDDIAATCAQVTELGGTVLDTTNIGHAVFVRDPDGQLVELLPMAYWDRVEATRPR